MSSDERSQPLGRLAAELGHFSNVRRVEPDDGGERAIVRVVNSGIGIREISVIREFGYRISSVSIRHRYVSVRKEGSA